MTTTCTVLFAAVVLPLYEPLQVDDAGYHRRGHRTSTVDTMTMSWVLWATSSLKWLCLEEEEEEVEYENNLCVCYFYNRVLCVWVAKLDKIIMTGGGNMYEAPSFVTYIDSLSSLASACRSS